MVRVGVGAFVPAADWDAASEDERYRARICAVGCSTHPGVQFSHLSAAAMWQLPNVSRWPTKVHSLLPPGFVYSARVGRTIHVLDYDRSPVVIEGVRVTSLSRTLIDVASSLPLMTALPMIDNAFHVPRRGEARFGWPMSHTNQLTTLELLDEMSGVRGSVKARRAIELGDGLSGSAGETVSRVQFLALGIPLPLLQHPLYDDEGLIGYVDFFWPHLGLAVEFDGYSKYGDTRRWQRDLTIEQIVIEEKRREDRMRAVTNDFGRLTWSDVTDRVTLTAFARKHGLLAR